MKKSFSTVVPLLLVSVHCVCQTIRQPITVIYNNLTAYSTKQADVLSHLNNQAALAQQKDVAVGVYGERRFMLAATSLYTAAAAVATANGNFGFNIRYGGFKNFNESQAGLAYARSLGETVDVGIQFNYYSYHMAGYGSSGTVTVELGSVIHLTDKLNLGLHVYNPAGGKFSKTNEKLITAVAIGAGYDVNDHFFIGIEMVKEENFPVTMNTGVQYQFMQQFFARVGIASSTGAGYAGFGVGWNNMRLDITASYHPQLGLSPGLLLIMNVGQHVKTTFDAAP